MIRLLVVLLLLPSLCLAVGAPDYLPDGAHPRIWLTSAELVKLNAKQTASDTDWVALEAYCDANINTTGYDAGDPGWNSGYRLSQYWKFLNSFALGYQILKDDNPTKALTYANYARDLLVDGIMVSFSAGEETTNGMKAIRLGEASDRTINQDESVALGLDFVSYKNGYTARYLSSAVVAYDWLYESGVFTAQEKTDLTSMFYRWYDWIRGVRSTHNNGILVAGTRYHEDTDGDCTGINNCTADTGQLAYNYGSIDGNFMGGYAYLMALIPIATYGDSADDDTYLTAFKTMLADEIVAPLSDPLDLKGGESGEGWSYGSSYHNLTMGLYGFYTGTGQDIYTTFDWPTDVVKAMVHRSASNLKDVPITGVWKGIPLENRRYMMLPNIGILQRVLPASAYTGVGQYWLDSGVIDDGTQLYENLLWYQPNYTATSPATAGLSLSNVAEGHGFVTSRSSWVNDATAVHFSLRLEGKMSAGYDGYDEGSFYVQRGDDKLVDRSTLSQASVMSSSLVFNNASHHATNPVLTEKAIDRFEDGANYMYVSGDTQNAWDRQYKTSNALMVRKSALHLRSEDIIVLYDVARSNTAVSDQKDWYVQYSTDPVIAGDVITATKGSSKMFISALYPAGTISEDAPVTGYYRTKFTPTVQQEYEQFLHVIEVGAAADTQTATSLIAGTGGRGALVGTTATMFTNSPSNADISVLSYTADATTHYIADVPPSTAVDITKGGVAIPESPITSSTAGLISFTTTAGSADYVVTAGTPPATITCYKDSDGDLYSDGTSEIVTTCSANYYESGSLTATSGDCNDTNAAINPGATDICGNGIIEDCVADVACTPSTNRALYGPLYKAPRGSGKMVRQ